QPRNLQGVRSLASVRGQRGPLRTPQSSSDTTMTNMPADFVVTQEHRRFAEFCEACRHYRYIGLCYGPPGGGKPLSARAYAQWDRVEASQPITDASEAALADALDSDTVLSTPSVVNTPGQAERDIPRLRSALRPIPVEPPERTQRVQLDAVRKEERAQ